MHIFPTCDNFIYQGITTTVGANCGLSSLNYNTEKFSEFLDRASVLHLSINYVPLVAFGPVRSIVLKDDFKRVATQTEINLMKTFIEEAMKAGAYGMSSGLDYEPQEFASTYEIIELAKVVANFGGYYATHHYHVQDQWGTAEEDESGYGIFHGPVEDGWYGIYRGLLQALEIAESADVPLQISHLGNVFKLLQPHSESLDIACAQATLDIIDDARNKGIDVSFDTFPNNRSICAPRSIVNEFRFNQGEKLQWLRNYSEKEFIEKLQTQEFRNKIFDIERRNRLKLSMIHTRINPYWPHYFIITSSKILTYENRTIAQLLNESSDPSQDPLKFIFDLMIEDPGIEWTQKVDTRLMGPIAEELMKHPYAMPLTDMIVLPSVRMPFEEMVAKVKENYALSGQKITEEEIAISSNVPNFYGLFPDFIHRYVVQKKILSIETAIYKLTGLPAQRLGIHDRGRILETKAADLVIFDLDEIQSRSTWQNVARIPLGIKYVIVNGIIVAENGIHTQARPGKILRKNKN